MSDEVRDLRVAEDAWPLIRAFREAGGRGFESLGVDGAREAYTVSCAQNAIASVEMAQVRNLVVGASHAIAARLYMPRSAGEAPPVALFLHGGGWVIGDLETHDALCRYMADRSGVAVLSIDYRLAPEHPFPAAIDDAREAMAWLLDTPRALGFSPPCVAVMGDSAGGGMAAVLAQEFTGQRSGPRLVGQVLLYPVTDLTMQTASYERVLSGFPLTAATMAWFADLYIPSGIDRRHAGASPLLGRHPVQPAAAFICTVGQDPLSDEGIAYAGAIARSGGRVEHLHLPHHAHGLFTAAGKIETGRAVLDRAARFLAESCGLGR